MIKRQIKMLTTTTVAMIPPTNVAGMGEVEGRVLLRIGVGLGTTTAAIVGLAVTTGVCVGIGLGAGGTLAMAMVRMV